MKTRTGHRPALGVALIALGLVALLNRTIDWFPGVWELGPAIVAAFLATRILTGAARANRLWLLGAVIALLVWQVAIIANLVIDGGLIWPALIIAVGVALLVQALRRSRQPGTEAGTLALFGQTRRRISGSLPGALQATAAFGSCEFDLRDAEVDAPPVRLDALALFGSIELRVPPDWNIDTTEATATLGSVTDEHSSGTSEPKLKISGNALFGSIEIRR